MWSAPGRRSIALRRTTTGLVSMLRAMVSDEALGCPYLSVSTAIDVITCTATGNTVEPYGSFQL